MLAWIAQPVELRPRFLYNPELRSTLFLVPGLIAYIAMLAAVVSTALSVVREMQAKAQEQYLGRLKALEDENSKLKKLLAEAMLDNAMLKDIASKKW